MLNYVKLQELAVKTVLFMKILNPFFISLFLFSINLNAQDFSETISNHLVKLNSEGVIGNGDINWDLSSQHISSISNINHIYFYQTVNEIEINTTASSIHLLPNGDVLKSSNNFIKNSTEKIRGTSAPSISALNAIQLITGELGYSVTKPLKIIKKENGKNQKTLISDGGFSVNDIPIELIYFLDKNNELILAWKVAILETSLEHSWEIYVNASSGIILDKYDLIIYCNNESESHYEASNSFNLSIPKTPKSILIDCEECYEVIAFPNESPYYAERSIVVNPANTTASPFGWHDLDGVIGGDTQTTLGNNINAIFNSGYHPNGGAFLDFTGYSFNQDFSLEEKYEDASLTNLFYWGNIVHDILYQYGFNEESGNFQANNYGEGGFARDAVITLGQVDLNLCNAAFRPTVDGDVSTIYMNACGDKDGNFDNLVIIHEYVHGLTTRLIGGANNIYCYSSNEKMTEGWSDWYSLVLTINAEDYGERPRGFATYLFDEGPDGVGVRQYKNSTDMEVNPYTYDSIKTNNPNFVWSAILWEITWALIDKYGYSPDIYNFTGNVNQDAGNIIALAIVSESLKLLNCRPGFVDARDAIFEASRSIYGESIDCVLWEGFAKRGLGVNALQGSSLSIDDGVEDFTTPSKYASFNSSVNDFCPNNGVIINLEGGKPFGGTYSGTGIIDDGNGSTFSFNPAIAGLGSHTIIYEVPDAFCSIASLAEDVIIVKIDVDEPILNCINNSSIIIPENLEQYTIIDYSTIMPVIDNCGTPSFIQDPAPGTLVGIGNVIINVESEDVSGNKSNCSFTLTIERAVENVENIISIYPNPANRVLFMSSSKNISFLNASVFDLNGRLIQTNEFNDFGFERKLNLVNLATGMYFLKISTADFSIVKRILKE